MSDQARIKIAAAVTALFLAGISAAGLAFSDDSPRAANVAAPATASPAPAPTGVAEQPGDDDRHDDAGEGIEDDD
jgi:hypothetical protein